MVNYFPMMKLFDECNVHRLNKAGAMLRFSETVLALLNESLRSEIVKAMEQNDTKQRLQEMGLNSNVIGPKEFNQFLQNEYKKWGPVIQSSNLSSTY